MFHVPFLHAMSTAVCAIGRCVLPAVRNVTVNCDAPGSTEFKSIWKEILEITFWKVRRFVLDRRH
jgi:hypothetical protein